MQTYQATKEAMIRRLGQMQNPLAMRDIRRIAGDWSLKAGDAGLDPGVVEMEAKNLKGGTDSPTSRSWASWSRSARGESTGG